MVCLICFMEEGGPAASGCPHGTYLLSSSASCHGAIGTDPQIDREGHQLYRVARLFAGS